MSYELVFIRCYFLTYGHVVAPSGCRTLLTPPPLPLSRLRNGTQMSPAPPAFFRLLSRRDVIVPHYCHIAAV